METLRFDLTKSGKPFKMLNCTNGGPMYNRKNKDASRSCFYTYRDARIPYSRNHDSAVLTAFGGPYSHDVSCIFRNFDADENDPASYDFECTDEEILKALETGTKTFYRLGQTIEHQIKKHFTLPPKDFAKWARICEHIIRHYTEGWADGFHYDMPYWEIWNEPELDAEDAPVKRCWGGTKEEFFDFFETAAKHLKSCFPHLKIGGPAVTGEKEEWIRDFLSEMKKRGVTLDFFSWHIYTYGVEPVIARANRVRALLDEYGYEKTESILNEWNYKQASGMRLAYSIECMLGNKGGAFMMAVECAAQKAPIDMLMYYDTRISLYNGVYEYYFRKPLPGYYALNYFGKFYDMEHDVPAENEIADIYSLCGVDQDGKVTAVVCYYSDHDDALKKKVTVDFGKDAKYEAFIVDANRWNQPIDFTNGQTLNMSVNSFVLIREV